MFKLYIIRKNGKMMLQGTFTLLDARMFMVNNPTLNCVIVDKYGEVIEA